MKFLKRSALIVMILIIPFIMTSCSSSQDAVTFTGDRPVRGEVSGTVVETFNDDTPIEEARIVRTDSNTVTYSESDGSYRLDGVDNNTEITVTSEGYESESRTVEVEEDGEVLSQNFRLNKEYSDNNDESDDSDNEEDNSEDGTSFIETDLLIELSWKKGAEDLDAHLIVPDRNAPDQEGYHIYYDDQGSPIDNNGNFIEYPYAGLDKDILTYDKDSPERIKIGKLNEGSYIYYIKNFSMYDADDGDEIPEISESNATVRIRENGEWEEYNVPDGQDGMYWYLFEIKVDEDGYNINEVNEFTDEEPGLN